MPFDAFAPPTLATQALERLRFARQKIAEGHWCVHFVDLGTERCAVGWLGWHEPAEHKSVYTAALLHVWHALPKSARRSRPRDRHELIDMTNDVSFYNDRHTRRTVLKLFDRAIARAIALD